jgi:mannitol/fructose-specific phosphotransferase system IIA component (Ntr-type)
MIKLSSILDSKSIQLNLEIDDKFVLIDNLVDLASNSGKVIDIGKAKFDVKEREDVMSTGVGKGIAIPHAKTESISSTVAAMITLKDGVDYKSLDKKNVNLAFLLLSEPVNIGNHLRLLSQISKLLNNESLRDRILDCQNENEVLEILNLFEKEF